MSDKLPEVAPVAEPTVVDSPRWQARQAKRQRRVERFEHVRELHRQGQSIRGITRELSMKCKTVRRYLRRETCPDWDTGRRRASGLDAHREWIDGQLSEGNTNASALHRELATRGGTFSLGTVGRYVARRKAALGIKPSRGGAVKPSTSTIAQESQPTKPSVPSARRLSFDWIRRPEDRKPEAQTRVATLSASNDAIAAALAMAGEFADLIRKRPTVTFDEWLTRAEQCPSPELRGFADGIRRDEPAVRAAITETWSNGQVEAQVNRLKTIKRQMYGRAGFALLRARVIHA
jgi:transposase